MKRPMAAVAAFAAGAAIVLAPVHSADAAPDPGAVECDKVYTHVSTVDSNTQRVRFKVNRCGSAAGPRIRTIIQRNGNTIVDAMKDCSWDSLTCSRTFYISDPAGSQRFDTAGRLYENGAPKGNWAFDQWTT